MSNEAIERGFKGVWIPADVWLCQSLGSVPLKMTLLALASKADSNGCAEIGYNEIADICGVTRRSAIRNVNRLVNANYVSKFVTGDRYSNVYTLTVANGDCSLLGGDQ